MKSIFTIKRLPKDFGESYDIIINSPLYISENIFAAKEHGKRVLLEMVDTYPKLILGYSGGMDSSFVLCCIRDLIDERKITEDTIEIVQGIFTGGNVILTPDHERATKFANSLGFNPRIYKYDINEKWKDLEDFILKYKLIGFSTVVGSYQILFAMQQDGIIITNQVPPTLKSFHLRGGLRMCSAFDNQINFHTWDSDNYSSYITPFRINRRNINLQPYNISVGHIPYKSINHVEKYLYLWMIYLQCYPKMMEIFGKFTTIDWKLWEKYCFHNEIGLLREIHDKLIYNSSFFKLPNGKIFTEKDLLNYEKYKDVL